MKYFVYVITNKPHGVLYIGVTNNLQRRIYEHKLGSIEGFTHRYHCKLLVYFEEYDDINQAIAREKQMKWWKREYKLNTIEKTNPSWKDLSK